MSEVAGDVIVLESVRKEFGSYVAVEHADFSIRAGEFFSLLGPSGCGKTTLLKMIAGFEQPTSGRVMLEGEDVSRVPPHKRNVNTVFQQYALFPHMTVLDNVTLAPRRVHRVPRAEAERRALALLDRIGLAGKAREYPDRLSGGQQQRAAIVRALVNAPRLLLLDEVTSALDPELVGEVLAMVRDLKDDGMTMLIATHEMAFARRVADRVCFLDAGAILEEGAPEHVLDAPTHPRTRTFLRSLLHR